MKRSEMEQIIKRALNVWNGVTYDSSLECYILEQIEEAGMLPPITTVYFDDIEYMDNIWEKE